MPPYRGVRHQEGGSAAGKPPRRREPPAHHQTSCLVRGVSTGERAQHWRGFSLPGPVTPPPPPERTRDRRG